MPARHWHVGEDGLDVRDQDGNQVACGGSPEDMTLCAAAPDLIEACADLRIDLAKACALGGYILPASHKRGGTIIAKAKGA